MVIQSADPIVTFRTQPPGLPPPGDAVRPPQPDGYELLSEIGRGGMGVVYKARDRQRCEVVALKCMLSATPASLYRFKQEFRTLADVVHPNLVALHELCAEGPIWYFTMEFLDGTDLLNSVRQPEGVRGGPTTCADVPPPRSEVDSASPRSDSVRTTELSGTQLDRLRDAMRQLASGLIALHAAGKLHRDLKPSNVMVTTQGRVVILDFGLAAELDRLGRHQSASGVFLGTAAYAAPEQAAALPLSPASDWYSVGAILYQLLTGQTPFGGSLFQVLRDKQQFDPPAPCLLAPGVPEDLNRLCVDLLNRDPAARPDGREVLRRLQTAGPRTGEESPAEQPALSLTPSLPRGRLFGRAAHLQALTDAYQAVGRGHAVIALIHGRSGMGKTSLIERFLDGLRELEPAVILTGRCYESESVPFKALDSLMDRLSEYLTQLPEDLVPALLPRDTASLARVFPVLQRVEAVTRMPGRTDASDERDLRLRAFDGLRELLTRIGSRQPLVLFIDDLQWGDVDSAVMLASVLQSPDPPTLLLLGSYRSELAEASPFLQTFRRTKESAMRGVEKRELVVAPLTEPEAQELALSQLTAERPGALEPATQARAQAIARESLGSPFFVHELVQHVQMPAFAQEVPSAVHSVRLDDVLWARVQGLPDRARRLLEVVAVAGKPLPLALAGEAAELATEPQATRSAWTTLRSARLIGSARRAGQDVIEPYHDQIRETVAGRLAPARRRQHHHRLAQVLEAGGQADPETLAIHFHGADEPVRAARYYALGGDQAAEALAFDHAARLYGLALELGDWPGTAAVALHAKRGDALANTGRGPESAEAYLRAADGADPNQALDSRRRAAFQYCASGHTVEGRAVLAGVLESVGMSMPRTLPRALGSLFWYRFRLWVRGLKYREVDAAHVPERNLHRIDVTWAVSAGLSMIDALTGAAFQPLNLLLALRAGEPNRLARALAWEAALRCGVGGLSGLPRATQFLELAHSLAERLDDPYARGMVHLAGGMNDFCLGRWPGAHEQLVQAVAIFRQRCRGATWERETAQLFLLRTLFMMGEFAELRRLSGPALKEARERGDLYSAIMNGAHLGAKVCLADDDVDGARRLVRELLGDWPSADFNTQQLHAVWGETGIDLYAGDGIAAWDRLRRIWPLTREPQNVQMIHIWMLSFRARSALAAAGQSGVRNAKPLLAAAEADARRLEGTNLAVAAALARLFRAGVASGRGDEASARELLGRAIENLEMISMHSYAAAARWRLGELLGGQEGRALVDQADSWMRSQGIRNPARMAAMHAPGFRTWQEE